MLRLLRPYDKLWTTQLRTGTLSMTMLPSGLDGELVILSEDEV